MIEVLFDHVSLVTATNNKFCVAISRIDLHDVPENWFPPDLNHRLRFEMRFFADSGSFTSRENDDFH